MTHERPGTTRTRWWWVRHAPVRSDGGRIYGQRDISCDCSDPLVFEALARVLPRGAIWYASNLARTRETAAAIWAAGDLAPETAGDSRPHAIRDFAEQHLGEWQGHDRVGFFQSRPENPRSFWFGPADERPPGGESFSDLVARTRAGMAGIEPAVRGRDVVVVAHGGTIRAALSVALELPPDATLGFAVENCSITRLDHYETELGTGWRAVTINSQPWAALTPQDKAQPAQPEAGVAG
jgi:broad specificity phosphatase PhoE